MIERLTILVVRRRRVVLAATGVFVVLALGLGAGVVGRLSGGGFADPGAPSARAARVLFQQFHAGAPDYVLLLRAAAGVDSPAAAEAGRQLSASVAAQAGVGQSLSYWTAGRPEALRSRDGRAALILLRLQGDDDGAQRTAAQLTERYAGRHGPLTVSAGGQSEVFAAVGSRIQRDLSRAELIVFPLTFVLLVLVFGGVVAALLPLAVGGLAIVGTLLALRIVASFTDVSVYALNLTTGLGLGLGIDYALFVVTRYREQLAAGQPTAAALVATARTAGRTVVFSALTVALSLSALLVFPLFFLRSFAYAGIAVVAIAAIGATVVLPAMLAMLGPRIDALRLLHPKPADAPHPFWRRTALAVMRRPVVAGSAVIALLVVLGLPFLRVHFGTPDDRVLPRSDKVQQTQQALRSDFAGRSGQPLSVVAADGAATAVGDYSQRLSLLPGVDEVHSSAGTFHGGRRIAAPAPADRRFSNGTGFWLQVTPSVEPFSAAGRHLVAAVRATPSPVPVLVGGAGAELVDTEHALARTAPYAALIIAAAMFVILFLFTGSVVVPLKALVLNLLSLSATFGAMVWVFQEGHLGSLIGSPIITGDLDTTTPILMFCVAFGLSMDYEVFLLSRIKETYDTTGDNTAAVATGVERTGRLVSAAAALIAVVFLSFLSSGVTFIKLFGLGMALAVIVDATLVRGVLVPAFMRLAGDWNWWAPVPLRRLHQRIGVRDGAAVPAPRGTSAAERAAAGERV